MRITEKKLKRKKKFYSVSTLAYHLTLGKGSPSTTTWNLASSSNGVVTSAGFWRNSGNLAATTSRC